jgi:hypothetical protein
MPTNCATSLLKSSSLRKKANATQNGRAHPEEGERREAEKKTDKEGRKRRSEKPVFPRRGNPTATDRGVPRSPDRARSQRLLEPRTAHDMRNEFAELLPPVVRGSTLAQQGEGAGHREEKGRNTQEKEKKKRRDEALSLHFLTEQHQAANSSNNISG